MDNRKVSIRSAPSFLPVLIAISIISLYCTCLPALCADSLDIRLGYFDKKSLLSTISSSMKDFRQSHAALKNKQSQVLSEACNLEIPVDESINSELSRLLAADKAELQRLVPGESRIVAALLTMNADVNEGIKRVQRLRMQPSSRSKADIVQLEKEILAKMRHQESLSDYFVNDTSEITISNAIHAVVQSRHLTMVVDNDSDISARPFYWGDARIDITQDLQNLLLHLSPNPTNPTNTVSVKSRFAYLDGNLLRKFMTEIGAQTNCDFDIQNAVKEIAIKHEIDNVFDTSKLWAGAVILFEKGDDITHEIIALLKVRHATGSKAP